MDFTDFYSAHKSCIYKKIFESFTGLCNPKKEYIVLCVSATIKSIEWSTELSFKRSELDVLIRDIIPHFEMEEEYEYCGEIKTLYDSLSR